MTYLDCPLRQCNWRAAEWLVKDGDGVLQDGTGQLRAHLAAEHLQELQLMLAGADGGCGIPVVCNLVQQIDARQVQDAADLVTGVLVPTMRARFAREMAQKNLRPLDPWPAVQVTRWVWTSEAEWVSIMHDGSRPPGMRELTEHEREDGRTADLYQLELRTDAVPDTRTVEL